MLFPKQNAHSYTLYYPILKNGVNLYNDYNLRLLYATPTVLNPIIINAIAPIG